MTQFTEKQLADFKRYARVQMTNRYNMFDPRARAATGLDRDDYLFIIEHYEELAKVASASQEASG